MPRKAVRPERGGTGCLTARQWLGGANFRSERPNTPYIRSPARPRSKRRGSFSDHLTTTFFVQRRLQSELMGLMVRLLSVPVSVGRSTEMFPTRFTASPHANHPQLPPTPQCVSSGFRPPQTRRKLTHLRTPYPLSRTQTKADAGISAFPDGDNIFNWVGTIEGAAGTVRLEPRCLAPAHTSPHDARDATDAFGTSNESELGILANESFLASLISCSSFD